MAEEYIRGHGGIPTSLGYRGPTGPFLNAICISPNEVIVHGSQGRTRWPRATSSPSTSA